jgi:hypothetical protein
MFADHGYYTELCAGAAAAVASSRELTEAEWGDLIQHLGECAECQELLRNFMQVGFTLDAQSALSRSALVSGSNIAPGLSLMRRQLRPMPSRQGTPPLEREGRTHSALARIALRTSIIVSLVLCFALGIVLGRRRAASLNSTGVQAGQTERRGQSVDTHPSDGLLPGENDDLTTQLSPDHREDSVTRQLQKSRDALASAQKEDADLTSRIAELEKANSELASKQSEGKSQRDQLRIDLEALRVESEANRRAAGEAQAELLERSGEVKRIAAQLEDERKRNATLSEAQDFLESPDSHVLPIYDHDENGKVLYGRILYTEGKKLVFYAYNLPDGRVHGAEVSFYVWGEKPGTHQPVRNLGILRADSTKAGRWKLTFEDPNVLAKIDSVFVTAQPGKTAVEPQGTRLLSARLDPKAVH